jgi:hypothetical protein
VTSPGDALLAASNLKYLVCHAHVCRWKGLKKKMLNRREQLAALQQAEAVEIRRKSDAFAERVDEFRK